jgi:hypothetical protein
MEQDSTKRVKERSKPASKRSRLTPEAQRRIGRELRALYAHVVNEGVPERFTALLRKFEETENGQ